MNGDWRPVGDVTSADLAAARDLAHIAAQWPSRFARHLMARRPDDSHSNLGWDHELRGFVSHDMGSSSGKLRVGLRVSDLTLVATLADTNLAPMPLAGRTEADVAAWSAEVLDAIDEPVGDIAGPMPYDLPIHPVLDGGRYEPDGLTAALQDLSNWYGNAALLLEEVALAAADLEPGPSPVRCWPHHFDIATLVSLETGDPEHARAIGVGFAPGDPTIPEPYFYVNPWPVIEVSALGPLPEPGRWQTDGFVGAVATSGAISGLLDPAGSLRNFLSTAFERERAALQQGM